MGDNTNSSLPHLPNFLDPVAPNADMSMQEQYAQYGYAQVVQQVMSNPERDPSELARATIDAGMDVVYGEEHSVMNHTFAEIEKLMQSSEPGQIGALVLELPNTTQQFFSPEALSSMSREEFVVAYLAEESRAVLRDALDMYKQNTISKEQFDYLSEILGPAAYGNTADLLNEDAYTLYGGIYDAALAASEKGIPVIVSDSDRLRAVGSYLQYAHESLHISENDFESLLDEEFDDSSDVQRLKAMGINLDNSAPIVVHRGLAHINNYSEMGANFLQTSGFDDLLELHGRRVVTFGVQPVNPVFFAPDAPDLPDFAIWVHEDGTLELDRSTYGQEESPVAHLYEESDEELDELDVPEEAVAPLSPEDGGVVAYALNENTMTNFAGDPELVGMAQDAGVDISPSLIPATEPSPEEHTLDVSTDYSYHPS